ncbi:MAG: NHL repeat-containing protein, partial [Desulfobacterales bacterium]|nr:NHL repeat-containing protein [Desulfobacterales bacterium]
GVIMFRRINFVVPFLIFLLIVPATALCAGKERIKHLTSIVRDTETGRLGLLSGIFFDENRNRLYVTDTTNKRILAFDHDLNFVSEFNAGGALEAPTSLVRNSKGQFLVAEPTKRCVLFIDIRQRSVKPIDFSAVAEANSIYPGSIAVDSADNLYIVDKANQRILVFDADLRFDRQVLVKSGKGLSDVKIGLDGNIYALNTIDGSIRVFDSQGNPLLSFGKKGKEIGKFKFPIGLAVDRKGLIYVVDKHKHKVLAFNKRGEFLLEFSQLGWREGRLHYPSYIYVNKAGRIFIVDEGNCRISIFE